MVEQIILPAYLKKGKAAVDYILVPCSQLNDHRYFQEIVNEFNLLFHNHLSYLPDHSLIYTDIIIECSPPLLGSLVEDQECHWRYNLSSIPGTFMQLNYLQASDYCLSLLPWTSTTLPFSAPSSILTVTDLKIFWLPSFERTKNQDKILRGQSF